MEDKAKLGLAAVALLLACFVGIYFLVPNGSEEAKPSQTVTSSAGEGQVLSYMVGDNPAQPLEESPLEESLEIQEEPSLQEQPISGGPTEPPQSPDDSGQEAPQDVCAQLGLPASNCIDDKESVRLINLDGGDVSLSGVSFALQPSSPEKPAALVRKQLIVSNISETELEDLKFSGEGGEITIRAVSLSEIPDQKELSSAFIIKKNLIGVDSSNYPELDRPAHIAFTGIYGLRDAYPLRNGEPCGPYCSGFSYNPDTGTASMEVSGFSNYSIDGINISYAEHLDSSYNFISDITEYVRNQDDNWSEQIPIGDFVRVTFEENLSNGKMIDAYARKGGADNVYFNVYTNGTTSPLLGTSDPLTDSGGTAYITLENMLQDADTLDFQIMGDSGGYAEFDYIHDVNIGACTNISYPGTYVLTANLVQAPIAVGSFSGVTYACINIRSSNVVLDCAGRSISGSAINASAATAAIAINGTATYKYTNITIANCTYLNNYRYGIAAQNMSDSFIYNSTTLNNAYYGIYLTRSDNNSIYNSSVFQNSRYGVYMSSSSYNNLANNTVYNNGLTSTYAGFYLITSSRNNLANNTAYNNSRYGFFLQSSSNNNITSNTARNNTYNGFFLQSSSNNNLFNNTAYNNSNYGFLLQDSSNNRLIDNTALDNVFYDFFIMAASDSGCNNVVQNMTSSGGRPINYTNESSLAWSNLIASEFVLCNADGSVLDNINASGSDIRSNNGILLVRTDDSTVKNSASNSNYDGIYLNVSLRNNLINNTAYGNARDGFRMEYTNYTASENNTAYNNSRYGFYIYVSNYNNLTNNSAYNNSYSGFYIYASYYNNLTNNSAYNNSNHGFYLYGSHYNNLTNNTAYNNSQYGFYISSANYNNFTSNSAYNNTQHGFYLSAYYNNLTSNYAYRNRLAGFYMSSSNYNILLNNRAYNNSNGTYISYSTYNNLTGNYFYNNSRYGIYLDIDSNYNSLSYNQVYNNSYHGIYIPCNYTNLTGNYVFNNSQYGIWLYYGNYTNLTGNYAYKNIYGIRIEYGIRNTLSDNQAFNNSDSGISIVSGQYTNLTNNSISNNSLYGIVLSSSSYNNLSNNKLYSNGQFGIYLWISPGNVLTNNTAYKNSLDGIYITSSSYTDLTFNTVYNNSQNGIGITSCSYHNLTSNTAYKNGGSGAYAGFYLSASTYNNITSNIAYNNSQYGFYLSGSSNNNLTNNTASNNTQYGVYILNSNNTNLTDTHVYRNGISDVYLSAGAAPRTVYFTNLSVDNPAGNYTNYTILDISDTIEASGACSMKWTTNPSSLPADRISFLQKFVSISSSGSIDEITWRWLDSEVTGDYDDSKFELWKYSTSWTMLNDSPDTGANTLTQYNMNPASDYGILQNNGTNVTAGCLNISSSGTYVQNETATGAPYPAYPSLASTCVMIGAPDVVYDCDGYDIVNDGSPNSYGIFVNASATNFTIKNCPNITGFWYGVGVYGGATEAGNGTIQNSTARGNSRHGFYLSYARNVTITNSTAENQAGYSGFYLESSMQNNLDGNAARNNTNGIYIYSSDYNTLANNTAYNNTEGIYLSSSDQSMLANNTAYNNTEGIYIYSSDYNNLTNNTIYNNTDGFYLYNSNYSLLANNTIYNNTKGILLDGVDSNRASNYNTIINNTIYNNTDGAYAYWSFYNNFTNNTFYGNLHGVELYWISGGHNFINNTFSNNGIGVILDSSLYYNNFIGNYFYGNGNGVFLGGTVAQYNNFINNVLFNNGNGIYLDHAWDLTLINNTAYNNTHSFFLGQSRRNTLINNTAYNSYGGFSITGGDGNTLINNTAYNNTADGIKFGLGENNTLINNTAYNNSGHGIFCYNAPKSNLTGNTAHSNKYGIYLSYFGSIEGCYDSLVANNTVYNNSEYGIYLYDSNRSILDNNTAYNNSFGIFFSNTYYSNLTNNIAHDNSESGIYIVNGGGGEQFINNLAYNNTQYGIYLSYGPRNVINNSAYKNGYGITVAGSGHIFTNNTAYNNTDGISLSLSNSSIADNSAYDNANRGIYLSASSGNNLINNSAYNNSYGFYLSSSSDSNNFTSNPAHSNSQYGIYIANSSNTNFTDTHPYNNSAGAVYLATDATPRTVYFTNLTIDNPAGNYTNYTSLDISDTINANSAYSIGWVANSHGLPSGRFSFLQKFVNISTQAGTPSIDEITWRWLDSEVTGDYNESKFELWKYNSSGWGSVPLNDTPDTVNNRLTLYSMNPASDYGILQNNETGLTNCQVISSPGSYSLTENAISAPNAVFGVFEITKACVVIAASNVSFSCAGYNVTNDGTGDAAGILINGSASRKYTNVTITDCPGVSGYEKGIYIHNSSRDTIQNSTAYSNTNRGFFLYNSTYSSIINSSSYNSGLYGIHLQSSTNNNITGSYSYNAQYGIYFSSNANNNILADTSVYNSSFHGITISSSSYNSIINNSAYNNTAEGINIMSASNNNLTNNTAHSNGEHGILVQGSSSNTILTNNSAYNNTRSGITIISSGSTLANNTAHSNRWHGIALSGSSNTILFNNTAYNNSQYGFHLASSSNLNNLTSNTAYNNTLSGISIESSNSNNLTSNRVYNNTNYGINISGSNRTTINSSAAYNNLYGIYIALNCNDTTIYNSSAYNNTNYGINISGSNRTTINLSIMYNNGYDFYISGASTFNMTASFFLNPAGTFENYTNLSISDTVSSGQAYSINWTTNSSAIPAGRFSFAQKFVNISTQAGTPLIDEITWHWNDSEVTGDYNESKFELWKYNSSGWGSTPLNDTPDTVNNRLTLYSMNPASDYGILQNNETVTENCPVITTSATYQQNGNYTGAPNSAAPSLSKACVVIAAPDVVWDCNGSSIINDGTAGAYGIFINASAPNFTIKNCPNVTNYTYGFGVYGSASEAGNGTIQNSTAWDNTNGFYLSSARNVTITQSNALNGDKGFSIYSSPNNNLTGDNASNNLGFYIYSSPNTTISDSDSAFDSNNSNPYGFYLYQSPNTTMSGSVSHNLVNSTNLSGTAPTGIYLKYSNYSTITNANVYDCVHGIRADNGAHITISNSIMRDLYNISNASATASGTGIRMVTGDHLVIANVSIYGLHPTSSGVGISLGTGASVPPHGVSHSLIANSTIIARLGFGDDDFSYNNTIINSTAIIQIEGNDSTVHNCTLYGGVYSGVYGGISIYGNNNTVSDSIAYGDPYGFQIDRQSATADNNRLINNTAYNCSFYGFYLFGSNYTTIINNTAYNNTYYGFHLSDSSNNNLTNNAAYNNTQHGFHLSYSSNNNLINNSAYNNTQYGINISNSNNTNLTDTHLYNNGVGAVYMTTDATARTVYFTNLSIDSPAGNYTNYTMLDISDTINANTAYSINWTSNSSALPPSRFSFREKFVNISTQSGTPLIDEITWHWDDSEVTGDYDDSKFELWKYNTSDGWGTAPINATPDTGANTLAQYNMDPASDYGILQNNVTENCPVITSPGYYLQLQNYSGAPNDASDMISFGGTTCVKIASSDVVWDCNGYNITNDGTGGWTRGIAVNGSSGAEFTNITVKNCPGISDYSLGIQAQYANDSEFSNNTIYSTLATGFWFEYLNNISIINNNASSNSGSAFTALYTNNTKLINNIASNNPGGTGFDFAQCHFANFTNNTADSNSGGFSLVGTTNSSFTGNTARNSVGAAGFNVDCGSSENITFTNNAAELNFGSGFDIYNCGHATLTNNNASTNGRYGFYFNSANYATLTNNTASGSAWGGFQLDTGNYVSLANNTASGNNGYGFVLTGAANSSFTGNTARNNTAGSGFGINCGASENITLANNVADINSGYGFDIGSCNYATVTNNNATSNGGYGFSLANGNYANFTNNFAYNNNGHGIELATSDFSTLTNNTADSNLAYGFSFLSFNSGTVAGNNATNNSAIGFGFSGGGGNSFIDNIAYYHPGGAGFSFDCGGSPDTNFTNNSAELSGGDGFSINNCPLLNLANNSASSNAGNGFSVNSCNGVALTNNIAHNNTFAGFGLSSPSALFNNSAFNNGDRGFYASGVPYDFANNTAYGNFYAGFEIAYCTEANLTNSTSYNNSEGFNLNYIDSLVAANNTAYGNRDQTGGAYVGGGIHLIDDSNANLADNTVYNNTYDLYAQAAGRDMIITMANTSFLNPYGTWENYTSLSANDYIYSSTGETYSINWTTNSSDFPANRFSFREKYVNISTLAGTVSIDEITWHWDDSEVTGDYDDSKFELWKYNTSDGWGTAPINATPDTGANTLALYNMDPASDYGILQNNASENCPVITESGEYAQDADYTGAPNTVSGVTGISSACVVILASDVSFDCNGYTITGTGTVTSAGIFSNASATNITVKNCAVSNYTHGVTIKNTNSGIFTNITSYNNTIGFNANNVQYLSLADNHAENNTNGFVLESSTYNNITGSTAHNNTLYGFYLNYGSDYNRLTGDLSYNNTYGFFLEAGSYDNLTDSSAYNNTQDGFMGNNSYELRLDPLKFHDNKGNGVNLNNCNGVTLSDISVSNNDGHGIFMNQANTVTLDNITVDDNKGHGLHMVNTDAITITDSEFCYNHQYGIRLQDGTNTGVSTSDICGNTQNGAYLVDSSGTTFTGNEIFNNAETGTFVYNSGDTLLQGQHYYGNGYDLRVEEDSGNPFAFEATGVVFDNPAGDYQNYTNLSIDDTVNANSAYTINWTADAGLPPDSVSFGQKLVNISTQAGAPSINSIVWQWNEGELGGYNESRFELWKYSAGSWEKLNDTPDTDTHTLSLYGLSPSSGYGIFENQANVTSITAYLNSPPDGYSTMDGTITFNCSAATGTGKSLVNITLYGNWSGGWHANETKSLAGTWNSTTFTKTLSAGAYSWNCLGFDDVPESDWGDANFTFTIYNQTYELSPVNLTVINTSRYVSNETAGNYTTEGGNVTQMGLAANASTEKWAGIYGNFSAALVLSENITSAFMYEWTWNASQGGEVCFTENETPTWGLLAPTQKAQIDAVWSFDPADSDSANNTLNDSSALILVAGVIAPTTGTYIQGSSNFQMGAFKLNGVPQAETDFAFCVNLSGTGINYKNEQVMFELMVPTTAQSGAGPLETYYVFAELK